MLQKKLRHAQHRHRPLHTSLYSYQETTFIQLRVAKLKLPKSYVRLLLSGKGFNLLHFSTTGFIWIKLITVHVLLRANVTMRIVLSNLEGS